MRQWAKELILYMSKVYHLKDMVKQAKDQRKQPRILPAAIFKVMLFFFLFRIPSMEDLDRQLKKGRFRQLIPKKQIPSHDTVRRALIQWDVETLTQSHMLWIDKFKKNKGPKKGSIDGWRVAAIDGVELFSSKSHRCEECLTRVLQTGEKEYFHRAVCMQKVGGDPRIIYDFEILKKQDGADKAEGETTAAKRLIEKVSTQHGRVVDVLTLDALYAKAPIIHEALDHHIDVVIRMKEERREIMKDVKGLFDSRPCDGEWIEKDSKGNKVIVQAWDESNLTSWEQVRVPMRIVKMIRTKEKNKIVGGEIHQEVEVLERWVATTIHRNAASTDVIGKIAASRWDIENMGFHDLKTFWHMDHAWVHHPTAIQALLGFLVLAVNMFYMFLFGHLHHFRDWGIPLCEIVEEMKEQVRWCQLDVGDLLWDTS